MVDDSAFEAIGSVIETVGDLAVHKGRRCWGWRGCLTVIVALAGLVALAVWLLGGFAG